MGSPHSFGYHHLLYTLQGGSKITDPGNGITIPLQKSMGICPLTIAAVGETRLLPSATGSSVGVGTTITVVADEITNSGTCTVEGVTLSAEGDHATFQSVQYNGAKAWIVVGGSTLTAGDLVIHSTNAINVRFDTSNTALKLDNASISAYSVAGNNGQGVYFATPGGGTAAVDEGHYGGSITFTTGTGSAAVTSSGSEGGDGGNFVVTTGAGGAGDGVGIAGAAGFILLKAAAGSGGVFVKQAAPTAETSTTQTYAAAELLGGLITSTQTSAVTATLETGALLDAAVDSTALGTDAGFDWTLINLGSSSGAVTVQGTTGHTIVGNAVVAITTSATFRSRRTAANTWITYRLNG